MKTVSRRRAVSLPGSVICERCGRSLPPGAFGQSEKLVGSKHPWCIECAGAAGDDAESRVAYRSAYQRSYMRRLRGERKVRWLKITVPGSGRMLARWSVSRKEIRITGPFALREDALRILTGVFGVDVGDIVERGHGAGPGIRRQKTFSSRAPVGLEAWERGRDLLVAEGVARVGKGGA